MVAARIATEMIMEFRYKLQMLGVSVREPATLLGDNESVISEFNVELKCSQEKAQCMRLPLYSGSNRSRCNAFRLCQECRELCRTVSPRNLAMMLFIRFIQPTLFCMAGGAMVHAN